MDIDGTAGNDPNLNGTEQADVINGLGGNDNINGLGGDDIINGGTGDDDLNGGVGNDTLNGDAGNDYVYGGAGADIMDGGTGVDWLAYVDDGDDLGFGPAGVTINLLTGTASGGDAEGDVFNGFENLVGTRFGDNLSGDNNANVIDGLGSILGGTDTLYGLGGDDTLLGYQYGSIMYGGEGNDTLHAWIFGQEGLAAMLYGGTGNDTYQLRYGNLFIGNPTLVENPGEGTDLVRLDWLGVDNETPSFILPENIEDILILSRQNIITHWTVSGNSVANGIQGSFYNDIIKGEGGNDLISGMDGDDMVYGGSGNDSLSGGLGNDRLEGGIGNDTLRGESNIAGVYQTQEVDTLIGGTGDDNYYIDSVNDVVIENANEGSDTVFALFTSGSYTLANGVEDLWILSPVFGFALQTAYGNALNNTIFAGDQANTLYGLDGDDSLYGQGGDDILIGGLGADNLQGMDGNDTAWYTDSGSAVTVNLATATGSGGTAEGDQIYVENVRGSAFGDTLIGNYEANRLQGMGGNDTIDGGTNVDTAIVAGARSAYTVNQTSTGVFQVSGPDGVDTLTNIEFLQFDDTTIRLLPGSGVSVNFETADRTVYRDAMASIRDFDGNALGADAGWLRIGSADVNGDGDIDQFLVNREIGRFATVGTAPDGKVYFSDFGWAGETRVVGIYIDPLVQSGDVVAGSANDSQRRFQNDLQIENINRVLGADDYDGDGLQEVYFALNDGSAYLHAYMHADGNIQYANYQSQQQVIDFLAAHGFGSETYADWFS